MFYTIENLQDYENERLLADLIVFSILNQAYSNSGLLFIAFLCKRIIHLYKSIKLLKVIKYLI